MKETRAIVRRGNLSSGLVFTIEREKSKIRTNNRKLLSRPILSIVVVFASVLLSSSLFGNWLWFIGEVTRHPGTSFYCACSLLGKRDSIIHTWLWWIVCDHDEEKVMFALMLKNRSYLVWCWDLFDLVLRRGLFEPAIQSKKGLSWLQVIFELVVRNVWIDSKICL